MRFFIEYYVVKTFLLLTRLLPNRAVYALCKALSKAFFIVGTRRSSLTLKNIRLTYPDKNDAEILALAQKTYEGLSLTLAEILLMLTDKITVDAMIENGSEAIKLIEKHTLNHTGGTIILTGHFSNWELAAHFLAKHGYPMLAIGRRGNNHLIETKLTTPFREKYGNKNLYKDQAATGMIKCLKNAGRLGLLIDQKAGGANSVKVTFFGEPADTINAIAMLKLKYNPLILPIFAARQPNGNYKIIVKEPVEYTADEESDEKQRILKMTQRYNDIIEEMIRAYPEQWFWMHDRWRIAK